MRRLALCGAILVVAALLTCLTIWLPEGGSALQVRLLATDFILLCLSSASIGFYATREEGKR